MAIVSGPKHSLRDPRGDRTWTVVGTLVPPRPPRRVLRRTSAFVLEWGIRVFESEQAGGASWAR